MGKYVAVRSCIQLLCLVVARRPSCKMAIKMVQNRFPAILTAETRVDSKAKRGRMHWPGAQANQHDTCMRLIAELRQNNRALTAANRKLKELDRLKTQFLGIATHELRTPLSVILGYNSLLAESLQDRLSSDESESLAESISACKRLIRLVNSVLDVSQIESGKMAMCFRMGDLRQSVQSVCGFFKNEAAGKGHTPGHGAADAPAARPVRPGTLRAGSHQPGR